MSLGTIHDLMLVVEDIDEAEAMITSLNPKDPSEEVIQTLRREGCTEVKKRCKQLVSVVMM